MPRTAFASIVIALCFALPADTSLAGDGTRTFPASSGGKLILRLDAGGSVEITGNGGSSVVVAYVMSCSPECDIAFDSTDEGLEIRTRFAKSGRHGNSDVDLKIRVPARFDVDLASVGGGLSIDGVEGKFTGQTMGGELTLRDVRGEAELKTMGGKISLTDSELDGKLETMGGEVRLENVVGDVKGSSMGGNVRYKNVRRRGGQLGSPAETGNLDETSPETVQISTMGGAIEIEQASEGADLHTMGGNIEVSDASRFVRAKTMGGDIEIAAVDGWVQATTMGGDIAVTVIGRGGDVTLTSMSGDVTLNVPAGFGMELDLEIAYTRNSRQQFRIDAPGGLTPTTSADWDHDHGTPRKYIRSAGKVGGGGHSVKIRTVNGNIAVKQGG